MAREGKIELRGARWRSAVSRSGGSVGLRSFDKRPVTARSCRCRAPRPPSPTQIPLLTLPSGDWAGSLCPIAAIARYRDVFNSSGLAQAGLLVSHWETADSGRRRRVYALTRRGRSALADRRAVWQRFSEAIGGLLGAEPLPRLS